MVNEGLFREDLLYRINTIQIEVPPLRERGNDVLVLADFFLKKYSAKYNKANLKINQQAQDKLLKYPWPGNITVSICVPTWLSVITNRGGTAVEPAPTPEPPTVMVYMPVVELAVVTV